MTVVIVVPGQAEPWQVANSAFRLLVDEARALEPSAEDLQLILQGQTYQTLDLTVMSCSERRGAAVLLAKAAGGLRGKLVGQGAQDEWEIELIAALGVLEMWMEGTVLEE